MLRLRSLSSAFAARHALSFDPLDRIFVHTAHSFRELEGIIITQLPSLPSRSCIPDHPSARVGCVVIDSVCGFSRDLDEQWLGAEAAQMRSVALGRMAQVRCIRQGPPLSCRLNACSSGSQSFRVQPAMRGGCNQPGGGAHARGLLLFLFPRFRKRRVLLQHRRMPFPYAILSFNELLSLRVPQHEPVRRSIRSASATSRCRKRQVAASPDFIVTFLQLRSSAPRWDLPGSTMSTCESCSQGMKLRAEWPSSVSAAALTSVTRANAGFDRVCAGKSSWLAPACVQFSITDHGLS